MVNQFTFSAYYYKVGARAKNCGIYTMGQVGKTDGVLKRNRCFILMHVWWELLLVRNTNNGGNKGEG
jgi:hypothetical protein